MATAAPTGGRILFQFNDAGVTGPSIAAVFRPSRGAIYGSGDGTRWRGQHHLDRFYDRSLFPFGFPTSQHEELAITFII